MACYEHLPIYKQALDVAVHFEQVVAGFSRYHKYTLGTELRNQSRAVVPRVVKANGARDKRPTCLRCATPWPYFNPALPFSPCFVRQGMGPLPLSLTGRLRRAGPRSAGR